jgi:hypothetical protein
MCCLQWTFWSNCIVKTIYALLASVSYQSARNMPDKRLFTQRIILTVACNHPWQSMLICIYWSDFTVCRTRKAHLLIDTVAAIILLQLLLPCFYAPQRLYRITQVCAALICQLTNHAQFGYFAITRIEFIAHILWILKQADHCCSE